jgi:hypothetical protein
MEATRDHQATLVDLLDRVLDKGLVLHADVIISVSGIPLIGLKLSAILASVDTMIQYGIWADWDCAIRAAATEQERRRLQEEQRCLDGEYPVLRSLCSCRQQHTGGEPWRRGTLYLTSSRVVFTNRTSHAILFESALAHLTGFTIHEGKTEGTAIQYLDLLLDDGTVITLRSMDVAALAGGIGMEMKQQDLPWAEQETCPFTCNGDHGQECSTSLMPGAGI